jgi:hypothetical protein
MWIIKFCNEKLYKCTYINTLDSVANTQAETASHADHNTIRYDTALHRRHSPTGGIEKMGHAQ